MTQINKRKPLTPRLAASCCGPIDGLLDPEFFKALSDPTRVKLLGCLAKCGRACSVTELVECCSVDFSVVSRHLAMLERAGVVDATKDGRVVSYAVRYRDLSTKLRQLAGAIEGYAPDAEKSGKRACCAN